MIIELSSMRHSKTVSWITKKFIANRSIVDEWGSFLMQSIDSLIGEGLDQLIHHSTIKRIHDQAWKERHNVRQMVEVCSHQLVKWKDSVTPGVLSINTRTQGINRSWLCQENTYSLRYYKHITSVSRHLHNCHILGTSYCTSILTIINHT